MYNMTVPDTVFYMRERDDSLGGDNPFKWVLKTSRDIFLGSRVVVFALPGAFTPTCSTYQLPAYEAAYDEMRGLGVDEVYVLSVNDAFVMRKWLLDQNITKVKALPDGNGDFTREMGMLVDKRNLGFGKRSWRYSMVVNSGEVERMFEEDGFGDRALGDPYDRSSPERMLEYLRNV